MRRRIRIRLLRHRRRTMRTAHHRVGVRSEVYKVNKVETRLKVESGALQKGGREKDRMDKFPERVTC
jgi:hypothetical protein